MEGHLLHDIRLYQRDSLPLNRYSLEHPFFLEIKIYILKPFFPLVRLP